MVNGSPAEPTTGRVILVVKFTARDGDVDTEILGAGVTRREAATMLAKLAAELAQAAAREDEDEP